MSEPRTDPPQRDPSRWRDGGGPACSDDVLLSLEAPEPFSTDLRAALRARVLDRVRTPSPYLEGGLREEGSARRSRRALRARLGRTTAKRADLSPPAPSLPEAAAVSPEAVTRPPFMTGRESLARTERGDAPRTSVRLEFEDALIADREVGRSRRLAIALVAAASIAVGALLGGLAGSTYETNKIFDRAVADGVAIQRIVGRAERTLDDAQRVVRRARSAARPSDGSPPSVDYDAMAELRALEQPLALNDLTQRSYGAFAGLADPLMRYALLVQELWAEIEALTATTLRVDNRAELERTCAAPSVQRYGVVLSRRGGAVLGALVYLEPTDELSEDGQPQARARSSRGGRSHLLPVYRGAEGETIDEPPTFVVFLDSATSQGVLGNVDSAFDRYLQHLLRIDALIARILELQGTVITHLHRGLTDVGVTRSSD